MHAPGRLPLLFFYYQFKVHTYRRSLAGRIIAGHRDGFVRVYYYCCDGHSSNSSGDGGGGGGGSSRRARRGGGGDGDVGRFLFSVNYCTHTDDDDDDDDPAASVRSVTVAIVVVVSLHCSTRRVPRKK